MPINRRDFLRTTAGAATASTLACGADAPSRNQPNIVLIMADDMGFSDIGCYGGEIRTRILDSLAERGLRFRQFYNGARCCPTRASLLTGLYAHQAGVGHMMGRYLKDGEPLPAYEGSLNDNCVTIAEALSAAGYTTLMSGKWHVTPAVDRTKEEPTDKSDWPLQRGFDRFFGTIHGAGSFYDPVTLTLDNEPIRPEADDQFYYTTSIGRYAVKFLHEAPPDKPFFLYLPFTAPHWPLHAPKEDVDKYRGDYEGGWDKLREDRHARMIEMGVVKQEWGLTPRDESVPAWEDAENKDWEARRMEVYAAQVTLMDEAIGEVVYKLQESEQFNDTLILFLADNGGCAENLSPREKSTALHQPEQTLDGRPVKLGNRPDDMPGQDDDYMSYATPWANASNTPFRLYKHWVHEGGISSPLIAHWPAGISQQGEWTDEPSHLIDIMATCLDVAGADYPSHATPLEGRPLTPLFAGGDRDSHDAIYWEHEGNRAVRQGKWKLVSRRHAPEEGRWELYDLEADRTEMHDLAADMPERVDELATLWQAWADKVGVVEWRSWDS